MEQNLILEAALRGDWRKVPVFFLRPEIQTALLAALFHVESAFLQA